MKPYLVQSDLRQHASAGTVAWKITLRESLSNTGHFSTSPFGQVLKTVLRFLKTLPAWSNENVLRPLRQPLPAAESPSMNTRLEASGANEGTIITAEPSPHRPALWPVTSSDRLPAAAGVCQTK